MRAGFTAASLAATGLDITATDLPILTNGLLGSNVRRNEYRLSCLPSPGKLAVMPLDWKMYSDRWVWPDQPGGPPFDLILTADSSRLSVKS